MFSATLFVVYVSDPIQCNFVINVNIQDQWMHHDKVRDHPHKILPTTHLEKPKLDQHTQIFHLLFYYLKLFYVKDIEQLHLLFWYASIMHKKQKTVKDSKIVIIYLCYTLCSAEQKCNRYLLGLKHIFHTFV